MSTETKRVRPSRAEGGRRAPEPAAPTMLTRRELRALAAESAVADVTIIDDVAAGSTPAAAPVVPAGVEASESKAEAATTAKTDAFEQAARLFSFTGEVPVKAEPVKISAAPEIDLQEGPRRARSNFRKLTTAGLSLGVVGVVGALVASMGMPFLNATVSSADAATTTSTVQTHDDSQIQAFVASGDVENPAVDRSTTYSGVSVAQIAQETGIHYSNSVFTNNPTAAIQWPFSVGVGMSYGYGMRDGRLHEGIDFVPGNGAPIQAIADGTVRIATENGGAYGVTVYIDHVIDGKPITSHYAHMQYGSIRVKEGQQVKVGDIVGLTGNTGRSFGAHLHFELIVNGSTIDPLPWLRQHAG